MCSLSGQHQELEVRPRRSRPIAGGMREAVAKTPRAVLTARRGEKHKELEADLAPEPEFEPELQPEQYELLPPGAEYVPDGLTGHPADPPWWNEY